MAILQSSKSNQDQRRRLVALVPHEGREPTPASKAERKNGIGEGRLVDMYEAVGRGQLTTTWTLESILPGEAEDAVGTARPTQAQTRAGKHLDYYTVNGRRVEVARSKRNFQLGLYPTQELVCQLSKRRKSEGRGYRLAFTAPLTAFTAFCVALSQLTDKS